MIGIGPVARRRAAFHAPGCVKADPPPRGARKSCSLSGGDRATTEGRGPAFRHRTLEPTLDVAALTVRLRDTNAIGVFTKLALKNQMDDPLKQFGRITRAGRRPASTHCGNRTNAGPQGALRRAGRRSLPGPHDSGSREAIWSILADREKFNSDLVSQENRLDHPFPGFGPDVLACGAPGSACRPRPTLRWRDLHPSSCCWACHAARSSVPGGRRTTTTSRHARTATATGYS